MDAQVANKWVVMQGAKDGEGGIVVIRYIDVSLVQQQC
jgi:hypothetical protein